jgi:phage terminase large subunit GpA-like protein
MALAYNYNADYLSSPTSDAGVKSRIRDALSLPMELSVEDWAETYYALTEGKHRGSPYRFDVTPWMREIAERLSPDDPAQDIVFVKPTQIGATTIGAIWAGHVVHIAPGNFLYVAPSLKLAKQHMSDRVNKLVNNCPEVHERFYPDAIKYGVNTTTQKEFMGGTFAAVGTVSPDGLRMMACRYIEFDEVDAYEYDAGGEGDPISLALNRSQTYRYNRKHFYASTPLHRELSRIWPLFQAGDRRRYFIPCLHCGFEQYLKWKQVKWDDQDPSSARYECEQCGGAWADSDRIRATQVGEWRGERPWMPDMPRSYHLTGKMYSHDVSMPDMVHEWYKAQQSPETLKVFINTGLAEPSADETIYDFEGHRLLERRETYDYPCPTGVQVLTAGVDVQADRLELDVYGLGWEEEIWHIEHINLYGETSEVDVWNDLERILAKEYDSPYGPAKIEAVAIDAGYLQHAVYAFSRRKQGNYTHRVWPIMGADDGKRSKRPIWPRKIDIKNKGRYRGKYVETKHYTINTFELKKMIYGRLQSPPPGVGTFHFSLACDADFFDQLTAETLVSKRIRGRVHQEWVIRSTKTDRRNEVLDTTVYAIAALYGLYSVGFRFKLPNDSDLGSVEATRITSHASVEPSSDPLHVDDPLRQAEPEIVRTVSPASHQQSPNRADGLQQREIVPRFRHQRRR